MNFRIRYNSWRFTSTRRWRSASQEIRKVAQHAFASEDERVAELYKKARAGEITNFTGVSAPYEPPDAAEIVVHTDRQTPSECVAQIIDFLKQRYIDQQDWVI